jgi:hypothetical protein
MCAAAFRSFLFLAGMPRSATQSAGAAGACLRAERGAGYLIAGKASGRDHHAEPLLQPFVRRIPRRGRDKAGSKRVRAAGRRRQRGDALSAQGIKDARSWPRQAGVLEHN